jgi:hypothetical protein
MWQITQQDIKTMDILPGNTNLDKKKYLQIFKGITEHGIFFPRIREEGIYP